MAGSGMDGVGVEAGWSATIGVAGEDGTEREVHAALAANDVVGHIRRLIQPLR